jgi:hypothetical protein
MGVGFYHHRLCIAASHFELIYERKRKISLTVFTERWRDGKKQID